MAGMQNQLDKGQSLDFCYYLFIYLFDSKMTVKHLQWYKRFYFRKWIWIFYSSNSVLEKNESQFPQIY